MHCTIPITAKTPLVFTKSRNGGSIDNNENKKQLALNITDIDFIDLRDNWNLPYSGL
jgi:hypothetical protein